MWLEGTTIRSSPSPKTILKEQSSMVPQLIGGTYLMSAVGFDLSPALCNNFIKGLDKEMKDSYPICRWYKVKWHQNIFELQTNELKIANEIWDK